MQLNTGDIALVRVNKFNTWYRALFASLIKFFDRTYYHHVIAYVDGYFHEADKEVCKRELSYYDGDRLLILKLLQPLNESERYYYEKIADQQLKKKYDYWGAMFFQLIYRITGLWLGSTGNHADKKPFCSEHALTMIHGVRGYFQDKYKWSPGDIIRKGAFYYMVKWEGTFNHKDWQ